MNRALETTDSPFGRVVRSVGAWRKTFAAAMLGHRAVLYTKNNVPFSEVDEVGRRGAPDFPPDESR